MRKQVLSVSYWHAAGFSITLQVRDNGIGFDTEIIKNRKKNYRKVEDSVICKTGQTYDANFKIESTIVLEYYYHYRAINI